MRVLIVKMSSLGDVLHTFPAVSDLAAAKPGVEIDWLVEPSFAPLVRLHPAVSDVHAIGFRRSRWPPSRWPALARDALGVRRRTKSRPYDLIVDLQGLLKSALAARLAGDAVSGFGRDSAREPAASRLYRKRFRVDRRLHAIERSRRLLAAAAGYEVPGGPARFGLVVPGRPSLEGLPEHYVLLVHGTTWPTKHWPEPFWRTLIERLAEDGRALVLPWGNRDEHARANRLAAGIPGAFVLPRILTGVELAGMVAGADLAVGLDSGLMHIAGAYDVPGVWLFGPTDPNLAGPLAGHQSVLASPYPEAPCRRRRCDRQPDGMCCMSAISVDSVLQAVRRRRRETEPAPRNMP